MRLLKLIVVCSLLAAVSAQDDDAYDPDMEEGEGGYGGGEGEEDYDGEDGGGGGGEEEEMPPSPPAQVTELISVEDFDTFIDNNDASVVATFTESEINDPDATLPEGWDEDEDGQWESPKIENPTFTSLKEMSSSLSDYRWAYSSTPEVLVKLKSKGNGLYLYRSPKFVSKEHGDRPRERFPSATLTEPTVSTWLSEKSQSLVGEFSFSTKQRYLGDRFHPKPPVVVIFLNLDFDANAKSVKYVLKRARKVAVGLKGKLSFAVASLSDMSYELGDYGLESKSKASDILVGLLHREAGKDKFYGSTAAFSEKSLADFAGSFMAGELTPNKVDDGSSPPPPPSEDDEEGEADEADVVTLTSDNFEEIVGDVSKDKLIEFYAPWCGHCKALTPKFAEAATELATEAPNVVLAKMDATAHEPPAGYEVSGYPTLYFVKAGEGSKPVPYEGEQEADAMVAFIKENAGTLQ